MNVLVPMLVFVVFFGVIIAVVVVVAMYAKKRERERTMALKSSATLLGWQFVEEAPLNYLPNLDNFPSLIRGIVRRSRTCCMARQTGLRLPSSITSMLLDMGRINTQPTNQSPISSRTTSIFRSSHYVQRMYCIN